MRSQLHDYDLPVTIYYSRLFTIYDLLFTIYYSGSMLNAEKDDALVQTEANHSPDTTSTDAVIVPNNLEAKLLAQVAHYEAKQDEVADLIARVRHEINNPLTGVLGQAQLLLREELSASARKRATTIEELAMRMRDVVAQLRGVQKTSKPEDPKS